MKVEKIVVLKVEYDEVEKVIQEHYGFDEYSISSAEEVGNDVSLEFTVNGEVDDYAAKAIAERKDQYHTRDYMNDLARQGIIEKGTYIINVSW
jgi:hypothetical protein